MPDCGSFRMIDETSALAKQGLSTDHDKIGNHVDL